MAKGQVFAETRQVSIRYKCRLPQISLSFAVFVNEEVAFALFTAQHFPRAGYLNPLGDCLVCFAFSRCSSHGAWKLTATGFPATAFWPCGADRLKRLLLQHALE